MATSRRRTMGLLGWTLTILGLAAGLLSVFTIMGLLVPRDHVASRVLTLKRPPAEVFGFLRELERWPSWWKTIANVERQANHDGKPAFRTTYTDGNRFDLVLAKEVAPQVLVAQIDDVKHVFYGTWTYELESTPDGCKVRLTERGSIPNPLIRIMARMMMDNAQYINSHLTALAEHFGEPPQIAE